MALNNSSKATSAATLDKTTAAGHIPVPYGLLLIEEGGAVDHATMRSRQLAGLLRLMQTDQAGATRFCQLSPRHQDSILWLAVQLADEMEAMVDIVDIEAHREAKA